MNEWSKRKNGLPKAKFDVMLHGFYYGNVEGNCTTKVVLINNLRTTVYDRESVENLIMSKFPTLKGKSFEVFSCNNMQIG